MHLMKETMTIIDILCQDLQRKSQYVLNALHLVSNTKALLQKLRDDGWVPLFERVKLFCERHNIDIPEFDAIYIGREVVLVVSRIYLQLNTVV